MFNVLPLFKSHYSLGKSILTLEEPFDKKGKAVENSIFNIVKEANLDTLVLVEDNVSGLLQASKVAKDSKVKLVYGLRLWVADDISEKNEAFLKKRAKYIIFAKNSQAYKDLIKIWSYAAKEGFYYEPCMDFTMLRKLWNPANLHLAVPFYDSFLALNSLEGHIHVPQLDFTKPTYLTEENSLPFDDYLKEKVQKFAHDEKCNVLPAQSIFYKSAEDFIAYLAIRCLHNRTTIEKPELNHMGSDEFNFFKWQRVNGRVNDQKEKEV
jgi:DNA polymerase III alpha subunit